MTGGRPLGSLRPGDPEQIGPYLIRARIGAGGMGVVYLGEAANGRAAAVKVIQAGLAQEPVFHERFRREVAAARRVRSRVTVAVLDADPDAATPWVAFEYIEGPNLQDVVEAALPRLSATIGILTGIAEALVAIHQVGIVHRDLKPSNVLCPPDGVRVIDFGIAAALEATALTRSGLVGTPAWLAPEQITGEPLTTAVDVFAWGCIALYTLTGRLAFGGGEESTPALIYRVVNVDPNLSGVPDELIEPVSAALAKRPEDRPPISDILRMLLPGRRAAAGEPSRGGVLLGDAATAPTALVTGGGQDPEGRPPPAGPTEPAGRPWRPPLLPPVPPPGATPTERAVPAVPAVPAASTAPGPGGGWPPPAPPGSGPAAPAGAAWQPQAPTPPPSSVPPPAGGGGWVPPFPTPPPPPFPPPVAADPRGASGARWPPGSTPGWVPPPPGGSPPPPQRSKRRLGLVIGIGGGVVALIIVLGIIGAVTKSPSSTTTTVPVSTAAATTVPTSSTTPATTPSGVTPLAQLLPGDVNASACTPDQAPPTSSLTGLTSALICSPANLPGGQIFAFQFANAADYSTSFAALNKFKGFDPSTAGTACPPGSDSQDSIGWHNNAFPAQNGQVLECLSVGNSNSQPDYIWTYPTEFTIIDAQAAANSSFTDLDNWWTNHAPPP